MGIRLENVCYTYGSDTTSEIKALNNVNLEINKGEFVAIIGHTGSGKSTLIQHFNGLERPKSGNVFYNNENIYEIIITDYPAIVSTIINMLATIITACIFLSPIVIILIIKNKKKNKQSNNV